MKFNKKIYLLAIFALFICGCDRYNNSNSLASNSLLPSQSDSRPSNVPSTSNIPSSVSTSNNTPTAPSTSNVPSTSISTSTSEISNTLQTSYEISYDLGIRKTAKAFTSNEEIYNAFKLTEEKGIIKSISSYEIAYGGGNGGKNLTAWYTGNMIKIGTTSANGQITFDLVKKVTKVKIRGYAYLPTGKIQLGDSNSSDWTDGELDNKTTLTTCEGLNEASKEVVEAKQINEIIVEFPSTNSLKIATTNKKPLFITGIEFVVDPNEEPETPKKEFNITWKNESGDIIETSKAKEGTIPIYSGVYPTKDGDEQTIYVFSGWMPALSEVYEDMTYVATFKSYDKTKAYPNVNPVFSSDYKNVEYGYYPQTHVNDQTLVNVLNTISPINEYNWYLLDNNYYVKEVANVYNNEQYTFDDGTSIINGNEYWFKCEPIKWNIISNNDSSYTLLSSKLLDASNYYENYDERIIENNVVLPNNYEYSNIRAFLNDDFYNVAFKGNNAYIQEETFDNINDKIYLLTSEDYLNVDYGFESSINESSTTRECKTTDYARVRGAWYNKGDKNSSLKYNGSYWTRTATADYTYCAWNVNSSGLLSKYAIDGNSHSIRPALTLAK